LCVCLPCGVRPCACQLGCGCGCACACACVRVLACARSCVREVSAVWVCGTLFGRRCSGTATTGGAAMRCAFSAAHASAFALFSLCKSHSVWLRVLLSFGSSLIVRQIVHLVRSRDMKTSFLRIQRHAEPYSNGCVCRDTARRSGDDTIQR